MNATLTRLFRNAGFSTYCTPRGVEVSLCRPIGKIEVELVLIRAGLSARLSQLDSRTVVVNA